MVKKWIYEGKVFHKRLKPFRHEFAYKIFLLKFPISQLSELENSIFSLDSFNLFSIFSRDYLDGSSRPLADKIKDVLNSENISIEGEVVLHTLPRILGFGFNPVNFWYIYNKEGMLVAILNEVNNTFGDRHYYLLQSYPEYKKIITKKVFHVSPFFDIKGEYEFSYHANAVSINYLDKEANDTFFKSEVVLLKNHDYSAKNMLFLFFKYPLMSFMVVYRIHWQALKLFLKKATFYTRPNPPIKNLTKEVYR